MQVLNNTPRFYISISILFCLRCKGKKDKWRRHTQMHAICTSFLQGAETDGKHGMRMRSSKTTPEDLTHSLTAAVNPMHFARRRPSGLKCSHLHNIALCACPPPLLKVTTNSRVRQIGQSRPVSEPPRLHNSSVLLPLTVAKYFTCFVFPRISSTPSLPKLFIENT